MCFLSLMDFMEQSVSCADIRKLEERKEGRVYGGRPRGSGVYARRVKPGLSTARGLDHHFCFFLNLQCFFKILMSHKLAEKDSHIICSLVVNIHFYKMFL